MLLLCVSFAGIPVCLEPDDFGQQRPKGSKEPLTRLCSNKDGKDLITNTRRWQQQSQEMAGPHLCFPTLVTSPTFHEFGLRQHCPQQQVFLKGALCTWGFRSVWDWEGQKTAPTPHPLSRPWRPWRGSSSFFIAHGTLKMKRLYPVSKNSCSYRKFWGVFSFFPWLFSLTTLL